MRFFSDNAAPAHPLVIEAMAKAARVDTAYEGDALTASLDAAFSKLFETSVKAMWVSTGTAANALALATLCPPYRGIVCHRDAHIENDEAGAPEFYTHGAKLLLAEGVAAKLTPATIASRLNAIANDVHRVQPAVISIANATEYGQCYSAAEVSAIGALAHERGLRLHLDGARFANAIVHTGASPADMTWRAGVDILSFGFVKNGGLSAEALVFFDKGLAAEALIRQKRAGHLLSKGRYLAAQILALLEDDLWLANARASNAGAQLLAQAAGDRLIHAVEANEVFVRMSPDEASKLRSQGYDFYDWAEGEVRFVTSWDQTATQIAPFAAAIAAL